MKKFGYSKIIVDDLLHLYGFWRHKIPFMLPQPAGYFFYLTARCNLACDYCWQRERPDHPLPSMRNCSRELATEEWIKVIERMPRFSFVGLSGGEPLLYPGFVDLIRFLAKRHPYTVNTNGALLSENMVEQLIDNRVANISISLDGFSDIHDVSRKRKGLFDQITKSIASINELKSKRNLKYPKLTIKTVLLDGLKGRLVEFYDFCSGTLKADCLNISVMKTTNHAQYDFRVYDYFQEIQDLGIPKCFDYVEGKSLFEELSRLLEHAHHKACEVLLYPRLSKGVSPEALHRSQGTSVFGACHIPWSLMAVLADGTVIPCLSLNIGNVRDLNYDLKKVNNSEKYRQFLSWRTAMNEEKKSPSVCNMCCFAHVTR